jgi:hypothetical protein
MEIFSARPMNGGAENPPSTLASFLPEHIPDTQLHPVENLLEAPQGDALLAPFEPKNGGRGQADLLRELGEGCAPRFPQPIDLIPGRDSGAVSGMATPKGMRAVQLPVNATDAVHVYSDEHHIWIQLRRNVPTEHDIGRASFKAAICLTPGTAHKLGLELLNIAERNKEKQKSKSVPPKGPPAKSKP